MKLLRLWVVVLVTALLCGCFQVEDELTVQPDGSGVVRMAVHTSLPEELIQTIQMYSRQGLNYPPAGEAEARRFFPAKDFTLKVEEKRNEQGQTITIEAAFKQIKALLDSPYARAHQLSLTREANGSLQLRALSGGEAAARAADLKAEEEFAGFPVPGLEDAQKKKGETRFEFKVTLPNPIAASNGSKEGKTAKWKIERAQCKDDAEFVSRVAGLLEASCPGEGLSFTPVTPPRLALRRFADLAPGKFSGTGTLPDTNKVAAAAKFIPVSLQVTRSVDLSGEGGLPSQAQLTAAVVLPPEFVPQRWGEARLEEVVDAKGQSLMPKEGDDSGSQMTHRYGLGRFSGSEDEAEEDGGPPKERTENVHLVTLAFKAPIWKVKQIGRIRALLELRYLGGSELVKLSNAVPASLVVDMKTPRASHFSIDRAPGRISDPRLAELGMELQVQMARVQSGMTALSLELGGTRAALTDIQLFDSEGKAWPTMVVQQNEAGGSCQVVVTGQPKPPFSLALLVSSVGASVSLPLLLEKLPVSSE